MAELVLTDQTNEFFEIVLNRPDKRNAIDLEMLQQFEQAVRAANRAQGVRCVFLRGEGKSFSAGIDVTSFMELPQRYGEGWIQRMRSVTHDYQRVVTLLERLEVPVIALLHGFCLGLAMEIALACDFRIAARGAKLGLPEVRLGVAPDVGGTTRLTRLVGPSRAKELIYSGKNLDADQALSWGIVDRVVPREELVEAGEEFAGQFDQSAPLAIAAVKRAVDGMHDLDRGLQMEAWAVSQLVKTEDFREAVQAFMEKRPPEFKGK
jgi:enoyl-CoA hydratase/carnithine racemase